MSRYVFTDEDCRRGALGRAAAGGRKTAGLPGWMAYLARLSNAWRTFNREELARR